jgi:hypothetical protein
MNPELDVQVALRTAAALFGLAAVGGILMVFMRLRGAPRPPTLLAMIHGLLAAAGLTLLIYFAVAIAIPSGAKIATAVLLVAALGGVFLNVRYHSQMQPLPVPIVLVHGLIAVAGFVILVFSLRPSP